MEVEWHLFCIFSLFNSKFQNFWRVEGWHCTNHRWREGVESEVAWLNQEFSQSSLEPFVLSFYMLDRSMFVQHVGRRSRMCVRHAWEISPTLIVVPAFILIKKNKKKQTGALLVETIGSLNFIIIIIMIVIFSF